MQNAFFFLFSLRVLTNKPQVFQAQSTNCTRKSKMRIKACYKLMRENHICKLKLILFNDISVHISENSNKPLRVTSSQQQLSVWRFVCSQERGKLKHPPFLSVIARYFVTVANLAIYGILLHISSTPHQPFLGLFRPLLCIAFNSCYIASSLHKAMRSATACPPSCLITHCN